MGSAQRAQADLFLQRHIPAGLPSVQRSAGTLDRRGLGSPGDWIVPGWVPFGIGAGRSWPFLRTQGYVALTCSFAHIFYANLNAPRTSSLPGPAVVNVMLLVPIYFWIYWRLHAKKTDVSAVESKIRIEY